MKIKRCAMIVRAEKRADAGGKFASVEFRAIGGSASFNIPIDQYPTREEIVSTDYVLTIEPKKRKRVAWVVKSGTLWRTGPTNVHTFTSNKSKRYEFSSREAAWESAKQYGGRVVKVKAPV